DFLPKLQAHLLACILGLSYSGDEHDFSPQQLRQVVLVNNRLYAHKVLHINYTSYNTHRCEETLNPRTNSDFMAMSHDAHNPFWYGRILHIFHVVVHHPELATNQQMDFLWVRWFGINHSFSSGWHA
ncbi:hypothetical protein BDN71DRAFT_1393825, partial [Pleurotus eryngii]